ncbi:hypothetical protein BC835DRAFT_1421536 [Cytidiella melzeri]|nr:hypothetical protein BC835DRAFT_1421536 [Cytidiella melzeri]
MDPATGTQEASLTESADFTYAVHLRHRPTFDSGHNRAMPKDRPEALTPAQAMAATNTEQPLTALCREQTSSNSDAHLMTSVGDSYATAELRFPTHFSNAFGPSALLYRLSGFQVQHHQPRRLESMWNSHGEGHAQTAPHQSLRNLKLWHSATAITGTRLAAMSLWRKDNEDKTVCNACGLYRRLHGSVRLKQPLRAQELAAMCRHVSPELPDSPRWRAVLVLVVRAVPRANKYVVLTPTDNPFT